MPHLPPSERRQLDLFSGNPAPAGIRDYQDLMAFPFFSLAKGRRINPRIYNRDGVAIKVEAVPEYGMATIWDADILIWSASQIMDARNRGSQHHADCVSCHINSCASPTAPPEKQATNGCVPRSTACNQPPFRPTSAPEGAFPCKARRFHRFSWINEWNEMTVGGGYSRDLEIVLPDWFYQGVLNEKLVLAIDPAYFGLSGGIERGPVG